MSSYFKSASFLQLGSRDNIAISFWPLSPLKKHEIITNKPLSPTPSLKAPVPYRNGSI